MRSVKHFLMGVDLGTTNVKAVIYDLDGNFVSKGEAGNYPIISRHMNWAEQDAQIWWEDTAAAIRQAVEGLGGEKEEIAAVSVSSQGMGVLPIDREGKPLCTAQIWMDRRGIQETEDIEALFGKERIMECFGVRSDPYYQVTNILWIKRNQPEIWKKTWKIVLANTYLNYKLTGELAQDEGQAVMTMCYDIHKRCWSKELGELLDIDFAEIQPCVKKCCDILGSVTKEAAGATGLAQGTPVLVGGVDSAMALLEMGISELGDGAEITGTSSNNFFASEKLPPPDSRISFFEPAAATEKVPHLLFAPTNTTGENARWFRKVMGLSGKQGPDGTPVFAYLDKLAAASPAGCRGLYYYPYLMGERAPLWNNDVRGMYIGADCNTSRGDMLRAIYEGTSFAQKEICQEAERASGHKIKRFTVSGGCARSDIWMQIKASVLNLPVRVVYSGGGAPKGNAIAAGHAVGIYKDLNDTIERMLYFDKVCEPDPKWTAVYEEMYPLFCSMREHLLGDLKQSAELFKRHGF